MFPKEIELLNYMEGVTEKNLSEISKKLKVSTRSVRNYINRINTEIFFNVAVIDKNENKKYSLRIYDINKYEITKYNYVDHYIGVNLYNFPEFRYSFILESIIDPDIKCSLNFLEESLFVSQSTIANDKNYLNELMKPFNVEIRSTKEKGMFLLGNELDIRLFLVRFFFEFNKNELAHYEKSSIFSSKEKIENCLKKVIEKTSLLNKRNRDEIIYFFQVCLVRNKSGHAITRISNDFKHIEKTHEYNYLLQNKWNIEWYLSTQLTNEDIIFLAISFLIDSSGYRDIHIISVNETIKNLVQSIFSRITEQLLITLPSNEELTRSLEIHLKYAINRLRYHLVIKNPFLDETKAEFPLAYRMAICAAHEIEEELNLNVDENEIGFLSLYFGAYLEKNKLKTGKIKKVAIVCNTGWGTSQLIKTKVQNIVDDSVKIEIFDSNSFLSFSEEFDLVLSTVELPSFSCVHEHKISPFITQEQLLSIFNKQFEMDTNIDESKDAQFYLKEETVHFNSFKSKKEVFSFLLGKLNEKKIKEPNFKEKIYYRESIGSTILMEGLSMPHIVSEVVTNIHLEFIISKEPIFWNEYENVNFVVLLLIPEGMTEKEEAESQIMEVYDLIFDLFGEEKKQYIKKIASYNDFMNYLYKERVI